MADARGHTRALRGQPEGRALAHRLRHPECAGQGRAEQDQQRHVGQCPGGRARLDQDRGNQDAQPEAGAAGHGVGQAGAHRVPARVQVQQGGAGRAQRGTRGQALDAAGDEQPPGCVGRDEQRGRDHQRRQRHQQHGPPAGLVGDPAGQQQGGQHAEGVGRVHQGQREGREVPGQGVRVVQRRGNDRGEQAQADHRGGVPVRDALRQGPAASRRAARVRGPGQRLRTRADQDLVCHAPAPNGSVNEPETRS